MNNKCFVRVIIEVLSSLILPLATNNLKDKHRLRNLYYIFYLTALKVQIQSLPFFLCRWVSGTWVTHTITHSICHNATVVNQQNGTLYKPKILLSSGGIASSRRSRL